MDKERAGATIINGPAEVKTNHPADKARDPVDAHAVQVGEQGGADHFQAVAGGQQVGGAVPRLPRSTAQWAAATVPVDDARMQRGDLVFFNTTGAPFSHMGLYVGGEQFVHAPSSGGTVRKDSLSSRYFATRYLGARRVFAA